MNRNITYRPMFVALAGVALCVGAHTALAATWTGGTGDFNDGNNWDTFATPTSGFNFINNGGSTVVGANNSGNPSLEYGFNHGDQGNASNVGHFVINSGTLTAGNIWIGGAGPQSTGTLNAGGSLVMGNLNLGSGDSDTGNQSGSGDQRFTMNGGTATITTVGISEATNNIPGADSVFNMNGGVLNATTFRISNNNISGNGTPAVHGLYRQQNGAATITNTVALGLRATASGSAIMDLLGGSFQINHNTTPFNFTQAGNGMTYVNIAGGELILKNEWTSSSLLGIGNGDFRAFGTPLNAGNIDNLLVFDTASMEGFTVITAAVVPAPAAATAGLALLSALGLRRRRNTASGG